MLDATAKALEHERQTTAQQPTPAAPTTAAQMDTVSQLSHALSSAIQRDDSSTVIALSRSATQVQQTLQQRSTNADSAEQRRQRELAE